MSDPSHGQGGWVLTNYEWDQDTGESISLYERVVCGMHEEREVHRQQLLYWLPEHLREKDGVRLN